VKRRSLLIAAAMCGESSVGLIGCGGGGGGSNDQGSLPVEAADTWAIAPLTLSIGDATIVYQLSATLPPNVRRGGAFGVDPSGNSLPAGVSLSPDGVLALTKQAVPGGAAGVVFSYLEPDV
jgi:hypothetical protein